MRLSKCGFTLLEIILATIVFVTALFPIINSFSSGFIVADEAEVMTIALNLARGKIEYAKAIPYDDLLLLDLSDTTFSKDGFKTVVEKEEIKNGLLKIIVKTYYREKGKVLKKVELVTLISREAEK